MTLLATDDFNRANGGLGANWTTTTTEQAPQINSNEARDQIGAPGGARYTGALAGGGSWPANQYSEATVGSVISTVSDEGAGPAARIASGAQTHYFAQTNTTETRLYKVVATAFTQLGADGVTCATGDKLRIICNGTSISVTKNGTTIIGPVTDAAIAGGDAGIWCTDAGGQGTINTWEGGDLLSVASGQLGKSIYVMP